jgi:hypothetical protein
MGGERASKTASFTYILYYDTITTQILNWSQSTECPKLFNQPKNCGFGAVRFFWCGKTRCHSSSSVPTRTRNQPANLEPLLSLATPYVHLSSQSTNAYWEFQQCCTTFSWKLLLSRKELSSIDGYNLVLNFLKTPLSLQPSLLQVQSALSVLLSLSPNLPLSS